MKRKLCVVVSLLCLVGSICSAFESESEDIASLIKQLENKDVSVRHKATEALVQIGVPAVPALIEALSRDEVRYAAGYILSKIGKPAVPALIEVLKDENKFVRRIASSALGWIGEPARDAVPALIQALKDEKAGVGAASALYRIDNSKQGMVIPVLIKALSDKDKDVLPVLPRY